MVTTPSGRVITTQSGRAPRPGVSSGGGASTAPVPTQRTYAVGDDGRVYIWPGEGQGYVKEILADLKARNYDGGISIEPHLAAIFHDPAALNTPNDKSYELYVEYGRRLMKLLSDIDYQRSLYQA